jgi:hypothetical protein
MTDTELQFKYPSAELQINEIIETFDFKRVQKVMLALDWKWSTKTDYVIPSIASMKEAVMRLSNEVQRQMATGLEWSECSSGGFNLQAVTYPEGICYELQFIVASAEGSLLDF